MINILDYSNIFGYLQKPSCRLSYGVGFLFAKVIVTRFRQTLPVVFYLCSLFWAGCASDLTYDQSNSAPKIDQREQESFPSEYIHHELNKEIASLEKSMRNFSQFFFSKDEHIRLPQRDIVTNHSHILNRKVFIDWSGPVEQLLVDLQSLTSYKTQILGAPPVIPALVSFQHDAIALIDVIRDASLQVHHKADLVVYPDEQLIELRYR